MDNPIPGPSALTRRCLLAAGMAATLSPSVARARTGMNPRLSIADPPKFQWQAAEMIQRRFDLYRRIGIGTLRVGLAWWDQESADGNWHDASWLPYLKLAVRHGFRLKMGVSTLSSPPSWYMGRHPEARIINRAGVASPSDISYWYPGLHALMADKSEHLFGYLAQQELLDSVDYVLVDAGPAGEPIYPANWTLAPRDAATPASFWFYDPDAQADFAPSMSARYGGALDLANRAWGTSFRSWRDVRIPEPGTRPGAMWNDVLTWYRDAKRRFVAWQTANYRTMLQHHAGKVAPKLVLMVPGSHIPMAEWQAAVRQGDGDTGIKLMSESEFLIDLAAESGCWLQYTGVENAAEVAYLQSYMDVTGKRVPMWGENAGSAEVAADPQHIADVVKRHKLYGLEYINAGFLFDIKGVSENATFHKLAKANSFLAKRL